ncbi:formyl transferase [Campylobacter volucris]|uniref:Formyl transferase n=1 Tax=Campylobacter volucris TaxID=1031542 RepID=A0A5C7E303_9BACT|nr:formyltransferase family protein [Campylobacter volucris]TXE85660.1 formyl transferase [Campylobacter volucris]
MKFEKTYVIGRGKIALHCQEVAKKILKSDAFLVQENNHEKLDIFFLGIKNSLIISANNSYIFKKRCVENNYIVNFHNSLLPLHKGQNAHIWTIWQNDKKTGITWHKVDNNIDTGDIIIQKEIKLNSNINSLSLLKKQHELAMESFSECLNNLENLQKYGDSKSSFHLKKDLPNNGFLDLSWKIEKIDRFFRSMAALKGIINPKINLLNSNYEILFYDLDVNIKLYLSNNKILEIRKEN